MDSSHQYPQEVFYDIETLISVAQPDSILVLGHHDTSYLTDYQQQAKTLGREIQITCVAASEATKLLPTMAQYDVAVAVGIFETVDKRTGERILSRLRDVQCRQFCVALPMSSQLDRQAWGLVDMLSFGLRKVATYQHKEQTFALFKYHLRDYKKTPDWLNADNWANPEMWGKYWW